MAANVSSHRPYQAIAALVASALEALGHLAMDLRVDRAEAGVVEHLLQPRLLVDPEAVLNDR